MKRKLGDIVNDEHLNTSSTDKESDHPFSRIIEEAVLAKMQIVQDQLHSSSAVETDNIDDSESNVNDGMEPIDIQQRSLHLGAIEETQANAIDTYIFARPYLTLTTEEIANVNKLFDLEDDIIVDKFNIMITVDHFQCLKPKMWLNDQVIDFYMEMLNERDQQLVAVQAKLRKTYCMPCTFMAKLLEGNIYDYQKVIRWIRNINIFELDKVIIPTNVGKSHWALIVVDIESRKIIWLDSFFLFGKRTELNQYTLGVKRWLEDQRKAKHSATIQAEQRWDIVCFKNVPQQNDGYNCGVFMLANALLMIDNRFHQVKNKLSFEDVEAFRLKVASSIFKGGFLNKT